MASPLRNSGICAEGKAKELLGMGGNRPGHAHLVTCALGTAGGLVEWFQAIPWGSHEVPGSLGRADQSSQYSRDGERRAPRPSPPPLSLRRESLATCSVSGSLQEGAVGGLGSPGASLPPGLGFLLQRNAGRC